MVVPPLFILDINSFSSVCSAFKSFLFSVIGLFVLLNIIELLGLDLLNVFDKLNAPQVDFITESRARSWLPEDEFEDIHIDSYKNVSWRIREKKK